MKNSVKMMAEKTIFFYIRIPDIFLDIFCMGGDMKSLFPEEKIIEDGHLMACGKQCIR